MVEWKKNALYDKQWNAFLGQQECLLHDIALWKELSEQDVYCYVVYAPMVPTGPGDPYFSARRAEK